MNKQEQEEKLEELRDEFGRELVSEVLAYCCYGYRDDAVDEAEEMLREKYQGHWDCASDWAEEYLTDGGFFDDLPETKRNTVAGYFDYAAYGRDAELRGDINTFRIGSELHVFWA